MPPNPSPARGGYQDIDLLRTANNVIGIISSRGVSAGKRVYTFSVMKEFVRDGQVERTAFFPVTFIPDVRMMLDMLERRVAELETDGDTVVATPAGHKNGSSVR